MHSSTAADLMKFRVDSNSGPLVLSDLKIHGLRVHVSTNVTDGKVIARDPNFVRIVYFGAPQIFVTRAAGYQRHDSRPGVERNGSCTHSPISHLCGKRLSNSHKVGGLFL